MKKQSRTENVARNVVVTFFAQLIITFFLFVNRTIFIRLLGEDYLGLDGLFGSILTVFSLAELGIGNAIVYSLYKPIAENDTYKARQYIELYRKAYNVIILFIFVVGICLAPFINLIVNSDVVKAQINIIVIYFFFLLNTISSYWLAHRQAILIVNQQQSVVSLVQLLIKSLVSIIECVLLLLFRNYYLYLVIRIVGNYVQAILISQKAKKLYPTLCENSEGTLSESEVGTVKKNVFALCIKRIGGVVLASTDNIVINSFIALKMVGIYSNYVLIVSSIQTVTVQIFSAMTASIGNYVASNDAKDSKKLFEVYSFFTYLVYGFCCVCLYVLTNRFILLMWGEAYLLSKLALLLIVLNYFLYGFQASINVFRDTTGLMSQGKYRNLISALVNVVSSLILVQRLGIVGVILGTIISRIFVSVWYDPYILYKFYFNSDVHLYYLKLFFYVIWTFALAILVDIIFKGFDNNVIGFTVCMGGCVLASSLLVVPFLKTNTCKQAFDRVLIAFLEVKNKTAEKGKW